MASFMTREFSLDDLQAGLREAAWYSPHDRRTLRAVCDANPRNFTRWSYARENNGRYTGLLMVWPAGYATPIHDHAGLWGIEMVLQGGLAVDDFELDSEQDTMRFTGTTVLQEGESCAFESTEGHAHRCVNSSSRRPAITLHVYGGLLDSYRSYETHANGYVAQPTLAQIDGHIGALRMRGI